MARRLAVGAAGIFVAPVALVVLVIALLALVLPLWASALVVLAVMGLAAGLTGYVGYRSLDLRGPTRTINSVKETIRWAKSRLLGRTAS